MTDAAATANFTEDEIAISILRQDEKYINEFVGKANVSTLGGEILPDGTYFFVFDKFNNGEDVETGYLYIKN